MYMKKLRLNIPEDDEIANEWLNSQHDRSISIRNLIHDDVKRKQGIVDYFATSNGNNASRQIYTGGDQIGERK